jgi:hypothetical protein
MRLEVILRNNVSQQLYQFPLLRNNNPGHADCPLRKTQQKDMVGLTLEREEHLKKEEVELYVTVRWAISLNLIQATHNASLSVNSIASASGWEEATSGPFVILTDVIKK